MKSFQAIAIAIAIPTYACTVECAPSYCERAAALGCFDVSSCVEPGESACDVADPDACIGALESALDCEGVEAALTRPECQEICNGGNDHE